MMGHLIFRAVPRQIRQPSSTETLRKFWVSESPPRVKAKTVPRPSKLRPDDDVGGGANP